VSLLWAEDRHAERVSWYRQAFANAKRRDYFGIAKSASLRLVAMGAVFFSAGLMDVYSKIFQIYPNMPSIQPKRISLLGYIWNIPFWLVVSIIVYFPFHIWDVIQTPLTKSIMFQDGQIAPPTSIIIGKYIQI